MSDLMGVIFLTGDWSFRINDSDFIVREVVEMIDEVVDFNNFYFPSSINFWYFLSAALMELCMRMFSCMKASEDLSKSM